MFGVDSTGRSIQILLKMKNLRQSYYDSFSKFYDRFVSLHSRAPQGALKKFLAELAPMEEGERVLDIC